jgi:hypothetical protein
MWCIEAERFPEPLCSFRVPASFAAEPCPGPSPDIGERPSKPLAEVQKPLTVLLLTEFP